MVGTIRIDVKPDRRAIFRLVAIVPGKRGLHLGSHMLEMAEDNARAAGATTICLNSVREAYGFYAHHGYTPERWAGCTQCPTSIPVVKHLVPSGLLIASMASAMERVAAVAHA